MEPHRIALLGAGGFSINAHLPAIAATPTLHLAAVYSRSLASVHSLIEASKKHSSTSHKLDIFSEDPSTPDLDALLARKDIQTVVLALPISSQPAVIERALRAGKNVVSEKPVAPSINEAKRLIALYEKEFRPQGVQWIVAEQYAYTQAYEKARDLIRDGKIGEVRDFQAEVYIQPSAAASKTGWRSVPDYQGGFILDGGVHFAAGLRHILPHPLTSIFAHSSQIQPHLPPCDILTGILAASPSTSSSSSRPISGTFTFSFGTEKPSSTRSYTFRGSRGVLTIDWAGTRVHTLKLTNFPPALSPPTSPALAAQDRKFDHPPPEEEDPHELVIEFPGDQGVVDEFGAFGDALQKGAGSDAAKNVEKRSGPRAALRDLAFIEGGLLSSKEKKEVQLKDIVGEFWEI
ncbi:hypothetical protein JCM8547_005435 [Rhodosporidiobolus lusitaniae]